MNKNRCGSILAGLSAVAALALAWSAPDAAAAPTPTGDGDGGVEARTIASFDTPIEVHSAPGESSRNLLFVVERRGVVRVLERRRPLPRPFFNISKRVGSLGDPGITSGEQGLLSIEFAPDYEQSRIFYLYYTDTSGDVRVDRFKRKLNKPHRAKRGTRKPIIKVDQPFANHNGGTIRFGGDGNLWLGTGDGGSACDPGQVAGDPTSLLGKLIRIAPRRRGGFDIPAGNPYAEGPGRDAIYAIGLRNPFRLSFDPVTGNLAIADVGQNRTEEINYLTPEQAQGADFGWDFYEGTQPWAKVNPGDCEGPTRPEPDSHTPPVHEYGHEGPGFTGCSVTGGLVARDGSLPTLYGRYLYSDFCASGIRSFIPPNLAARTGRGVVVEPFPPQAGDDGPIGVNGSLVTSFGTDARGKIFFTELTGDLVRLRPEAAQDPE